MSQIFNSRPQCSKSTGSGANKKNRDNSYYIAELINRKDCRDTVTGISRYLSNGHIMLINI